MGGGEVQLGSAVRFYQVADLVPRGRDAGVESGQERRDRHRQRREDVVQVLDVRRELLGAPVRDVVDPAQLLHEQGGGTLGNLRHGNEGQENIL